MKILKVLEWISVVMIIAGIVLGLGKVAVDQIVARACTPVCATVAIMPPSEEEKAAYLARTRESYDLTAKTITEEMKARSGEAP